LDLTARQLRYHPFGGIGGQARGAFQIGLKIASAVAIGIITGRLNRGPWHIHARGGLSDGGGFHVDDIAAEGLM
jgi:hypothetical protein